MQIHYDWLMLGLDYSFYLSKLYRSHCYGMLARFSGLNFEFDRPDPGPGLVLKGRIAKSSQQASTHHSITCITYHGTTYCISFLEANSGAARQ
jgi:hypothetical protein